MYAAQRCAADLQGHAAQLVCRAAYLQHTRYIGAQILSFINKRNEPNKRNGLIEIVLETLMVVH